jgi:hypothetical protein
VTSFAELAVADLLLRLRALNRAMRRAVHERAGRSARIHASTAGQLYVTNEHAGALLDELDRRPSGEPPREPLRLEEDELLSLERLRSRADESGQVLPLDQLAGQAGLDDFETGCVLACIAPEIDPAYQRLYGYIVDDLSRMRPSLELLLALSGEGVRGGLARRRALGPFGVLRRRGVLVTCGEPLTELRQEFGLGPGVLDLVLGGQVDRGLLCVDEDELRLPEPGTLPAGVDEGRLRSLAVALQEGRLSVLGVWGGDGLARERVAAIAARSAGLGLRSFDPGRGEPGLRDALRAAASLRSLLWIDVDRLAEQDRATESSIEAVLRRSAVPLCLGGTAPWRPSAILSVREYAEVELEPLDFASRRRLWTETLPEVGADVAGDLAARFRMGTAEVYAAASLARVKAAVSANGATLEELAGRACSAVTRRRSYRFATIVKPRRTAADLVLPADLKRQIGEIVSFYRSWPCVSEGWGFGRLSPGAGVRALFAGDAGTGKTLAAEVIASELGLDLLKVDLARVVSKWVGETEKNLEASFDEAEGSASVLFFDEADALFAKRGEVRHGTDRYANLEVGYLLQRLERFAGLVVLATNLRDNLDDAFTRRFNMILHFPRPGPEERRRIWELALPAAADAEGVDFDALSQIDMTGASIVATAQAAALFAFDEGKPGIAMRHVVRAMARQFSYEGRVLPRAQLGAHAGLG